ncbi:MAG: 50S ribosomal protein L2 [Candidatus Diapherotrites archaeon]
MAKRIKSQRAGKGSPTFMATKNGVADIKYITVGEKQRDGVLKGEVIDLVNDPGRTSVLAKIVFEDGREEFVIAAEGLGVGDRIAYGRKAGLAIGNVLPLGELVEGAPVFNIEKEMGDGGRIARASGLYALIMAKDKAGVSVKLPSGKIIVLPHESRATVGCCAAGGRPEKPLLKAGSNWHKFHARGHKYPGVRGVAQNPLSHPFGGYQHHPGKSKSTSRHAPPGRKVGAIASKRTGRRKKN